MIDISFKKDIKMLDLSLSLPNNLSASEARFKIIKQGNILPKYQKFTPLHVSNEETQEASKYTFVSRILIPIIAKKNIPDFSKKVFSDLYNFNGSTDFNKFEFKYSHFRENRGKTDVIEEKFIKFSYAGYHWVNAINLLTTLSNTDNLLSREFKELAEEFSQKYVTLDIVKKCAIKYTEKSLFVKHLTVVLTNFFKNRFALSTRTLNKYLLKPFEEYGYTEIFGMKKYIKFFYDGDDFEEILKDIMAVVVSKLEKVVDSPPTKDDILIPNTNLEPLGEFDINMTRQNKSVFLNIFKIVPDDVTTTESRMKPMETPYDSPTMYDPPIRRGVSTFDQPFKVVLANDDIDYGNINGDTVDFRRTITCDMITRALDWAALNGKPLPPLGTEIYIHLSDSSDSKDIVLPKLPIAVYARKRKNKFLIPFPEYSYGCFTVGSRFCIDESKCMTWDSSKEYVRNSLQYKIPFQNKKNNVFFKGAAYSTTGIRERMSFMSGKRIFDTFNPSKTLIPAGKFIVDIPGKRGAVINNPISIPEMGENRFLLDLPGYGMWSTRLKFILLTKSIVVRVMLIDVEWNNEKKEWNNPDFDNDFWETFFDVFTPQQLVETVMGINYVYNKNIPGDVVKDLNYKEHMKVINEIGVIYQDFNANFKEAENVGQTCSDYMYNLTDDNISEYIYSIVMKMADLYGFTLKS